MLEFEAPIRNMNGKAIQQISKIQSMIRTCATKKYMETCLFASLSNFLFQSCHQFAGDRSNAFQYVMNKKFPSCIYLFFSSRVIEEDDIEFAKFTQTFCHKNSMICR